MVAVKICAKCGLAVRQAAGVRDVWLHVANRHQGGAPFLRHDVVPIPIFASEARVQHHAALEHLSLVNGELFCGVCDKRWCSHVEEAIKQDVDTGLLVINSDGGLPPMVNHVPIFPASAIDLWVSIRLADVHRAGVREIFLQLPGHVPLTYNEESLGYLMAGEARRAMRTAFIEWLRAQPGSSHCPARTHNKFTQAKFLNQHGEAGKLADKWRIMVEGACSECHSYMTFDSDVPDVESGWRR